MINNIQELKDLSDSTLGKPEDLSEELKALRDKLHISKAVSFVYDLSNLLDKIESDTYFPILTFITDDYYAAEHVGFRFDLKFRDSEGTPSNTSFQAKYKKEIWDIRDMLFNASTHLCPEYIKNLNISDHKVILSYDSNKNSTLLFDELLTPSQLIFLEKITLESQLNSKQDTPTRKMKI